MYSSELRYRVVLYEDTDFSEGHATSIFSLALKKEAGTMFLRNDGIRLQDYTGVRSEAFTATKSIKPPLAINRVSWLKITHVSGTIPAPVIMV
jgi:hypothetical protein